MIRWILKGVLRDKSRSLFPGIVVSLGVGLTIVMLGFMDGILMDMVDMTANLDTGHIRFVNTDFYKDEHMNPLDRSLPAQKETLKWLQENSPQKIKWVPRVRWGAIMDVPDAKGETRAQKPVIGTALDLLNDSSGEFERLGLGKNIIEGRAPQKPKEIIVGYLAARELDLKIDETVTLLGQSYDGGLAADNYTVVGFVRFGVNAMDKRMALMDITGAQDSFYLEDMVTDWLGFLPRGISYKDYGSIKLDMEKQLETLKPLPGWAEDDWPVVKTVLEQRNLDTFVTTFESVNAYVVSIFLILMGIVLWNAGLLNGIYRYGELGMRLAMGESHGLLLKHLVMEAFLVGVIGALFGCVLGGGFLYYFQEYGIDMGDKLAQTGLMLSDVSRARVSVDAFIYAIIPGILANVLGTLVAGIGIFKRSEAELFRELEHG
jgi:putative ABC transport system permease protein